MKYATSLGRLAFSAALAGWLGLYLGCQAKPAKPPAATSPVSEVEVAQAVTQDIIDYRVFTGRTAAVNSVDIRARVSGYLLQSPRSAYAASQPAKEVANTAVATAGTETDATPQADASKQAQPSVTVAEGEAVEVGALLFVIDPEPYRLALQQSQGSLEATQAKLKQANQDFSRAEELFQKDTISRAEYDSSVAAVAELRGQIEALKATVARNQLDLEYTQVRAPIAGLLGQTLVTPGNLVVADSSLLTTVVSTDPIYVDFDVDEQSVLDYRTRMLAGQVESARKTRIAIRLGLSNEEGFPHPGTLDFVNNRTDPNTGNTRVRGTFDNNSGLLSPGLFAQIQVPFSAEHPAVLIPTRAIGMDQQGRYVMVVDANNTVRRRAVKLGENVGDRSIVLAGVQAGEQVVTAGLQKIRNGSQVHIQAEQPREATAGEAP